jgi:DEAD/DEAH box helicase domain-containing protein
MNYVNFDIETYSPGNLNKINTDEFRVSVIGAYFSWLDEYIAFLEEDVADFLELLEKADLIVGFNHIWFDLPVLQKYAKFNLKTLPCYDIMLEFEKAAGYKIKLNDLCKANFGDDIKTDTYSVYKNYYTDKKWFELIDYCMNDVRLTERLFDQIQKTGNLSYMDLHLKKSVTVQKPDLNKIKATSTVQVLETMSIF